MSYAANSIGCEDMEIAHMLRLIERKGVEAIEDDEIEVKGFTKVDNDFKRTLRRAAVCLANTSGGQIILGVDETTNSIEGCPDIDPLELTNIVFEGTRPGILVEFERHVTTDGKTVFHCRVPRSPRVHATSDGARFHRVGKKCLPLYPDEEHRLLVQKGALDITAQPLPELAVADLDGAAIEAAARLWDMRRRDRGPRASVPAQDPGHLLETLGALATDTEGIGRPSVACAILFASKRTIAPYLPGRKLIYVLMKNATEYRLKRTWEDATLLAIDEVLATISNNSRVETLRVGSVQRDIPDFPPDAVREVLLNAVAHRDYLVSANIMVVQHEDRIEITSPGGFIGGVTPENILHHNPTHRNPTLVGLTI
jgi:ATP-dependent DNA helicase RecG